MTEGLFAIDTEADEKLQAELFARAGQLYGQLCELDARHATERAPLCEEMQRTCQRYENVAARLQGRKPRNLSELTEDEDDR